MSHEVEFIPADSSVDEAYVYFACDFDGTDYCGFISLGEGVYKFHWGWEMRSRYTLEQQALIEVVATEKAVVLTVKRRLTA